MDLDLHLCPLGPHSVQEGYERASGGPARAKELVDCEKKVQEVIRRYFGHWGRR